MATSKAKTVGAYLEELPPDRRATIEAVRDVIRENLPEGYEEGMAYGMIGYYVPLETYPKTYNEQPLGLASLAAQKNYYALYLNNVYQDGEAADWFKDAYRASGKKLDMGKSCVRFKSLDDVPLAVVGQAIKRMPVKKFIEFYETAIKSNMQRRAGRTTKSAAKKPAPSKSRGPRKAAKKR